MNSHGQTILVDRYRDGGLKDCLNGISQVLVLPRIEIWIYQNLHFFTSQQRLSFQVLKTECEGGLLFEVYHLLSKGKDFGSF